MRLATIAALIALAATAAAASPIEELRVRAQTALRDAQACCNRLDDGAVPGRRLSPAREELRRVEDAFAAGLRLSDEGDYAFAREAFYDAIRSARRVTARCRGIPPRGP